MKLTFLLGFFFLICQGVKAQFSENNAIYLSQSAFVGNYFGATMSLNYIHKENLVVELGAMIMAKRPGDRPEDYNGGMLSIFTFGLAAPRNYISSYQLLIGKSIVLTPEGNQRLHLKIGPTWNQISTPTNWQRVSGSGLVAGNYSYELVDSQGLGFMVRPTLEFPITRGFGIGFGTFFHFHRQSINCGAEMRLMLGLLRRKY
ncbi:hypothetical protein [Pararhodonellum marinum]|uniref:hypothetical protein n=1 Tax=Pararhodonellum marinum TaxID=2755358 RepID=UPI001890B38F|nr:hypothetical protein [Pararhodonellum marinum]